MQKKHLIGYPIVTLLAIGIGAASSGSASTATTASPASTLTATAEPATVTKPAQAGTAPGSGPATIPGDGTYQVGVDIQPGTYASDAPTSGNCYWARLDSDDPFEGILANNNSSGQSVVVIAASDKYFQSSGCSDWARR